jgi:hypothetical protein
MHTQMTIFAWSASRSGPTVTVKGIDALGNAVKVPNVRVVQATEDGQVVATDVGNQRFALATRASEDLAAIVREVVFGDGTDASLQRTIDLCREARDRYSIERA